MLYIIVVNNSCKLKVFLYLYIQNKIQMNYDIPSDPVMLLSFVNMKLRDYYKSLDAMCEDLGIDVDELTSSLEAIDYHYDRGLNKFI